MGNDIVGDDVVGGTIGDENSVEVSEDSGSAVGGGGAGVLDLVDGVGPTIDIGQGVVAVGYIDDILRWVDGQADGGRTGADGRESGLGGGRQSGCQAKQKRQETQESGKANGAQPRAKRRAPGKIRAIERQTASLAATTLQSSHFTPSVAFQMPLDSILKVLTWGHRTGLASISLRVLRLGFGERTKRNAGGTRGKELSKFPHEQRLVQAARRSCGFARFVAIAKRWQMRHFREVWRPIGKRAIATWGHSTDSAQSVSEKCLAPRRIGKSLAHLSPKPDGRRL